MLKSKSNVIGYTVNKVMNDNIYISIHNGEVCVNAPWYFSSSQIQEIVEEKRKWIVSKLNSYKKTNEEINQNNVYLLGKKYDLKIVYRNIKKTELNLNDNLIEVVLPNTYKKVNNKEILKLAIRKLYDIVAKEEIELAMEKNRIMLGFAPEDYSIERLKNGLGKRENDNLVINPDIVVYDREIINYIVLHEFCHLKYKTHSKRFYEIIKKYEPNYKRYDEIIKKFQY